MSADIHKKPVNDSIITETEMYLCLIFRIKNRINRSIVTDAVMWDAKDDVESIRPGMSDICVAMKKRREVRGDNIAPIGKKSPTSNIMLPTYIIISHSTEKTSVAIGEIQDI